MSDHYHEDAVRERMERDADIARDLGGMLGVEDMRYYGQELQYAALMDCGPMYLEPTPEELAFYAEMNAEMERLQREAEWRNWRGAAGREGTEYYGY